MNAEIIIFTNGYGEDTIGVSLASLLKQNKNIYAFPFVGTGKIFEKAGISLYYKGKDLPSEGLSLREGISFLWIDIKKGLIGEIFRIANKLYTLSHKRFIPIVIGDFYPLILIYLFANKRPLFILSSKSIRIKSFSNLEIYILRHFAFKVFVRDKETEIFLKKRGVNALYLGNPIIGLLGSKSRKIVKTNNKATLLFLPGSRSDVYKNIIYMLKIVDVLDEFGRTGSFSFFFHLSNDISLEKLELFLHDGWELEIFDSIYEVGILKKKNIKIGLFKNSFNEILIMAKIVVGLSGTANEQSVALGKPVISFPVPFTHATHKRFTKRQKPLLKDNLIYFSKFDEKIIAKKIIELLSKKDLLAFFKIKGKETVGKDALSFIKDYIESGII